MTRSPVADALAQAVWPEIANADICRHLTVAQLDAIFSEVAAAATNTVRQQVVAVAQGSAGTAEVEGEGVVGQLTPTEQPDEAPDDDVPE